MTLFDTSGFGQPKPRTVYRVRRLDRAGEANRDRARERARRLAEARIIRCRRCDEEMPFTPGDRRRVYCGKCRGQAQVEDAEERRLGQVLKRYGITLSDYEALLEKQAGRCAICGKYMATSLNIDHDHGCCARGGYSCGRCVRGLLCSPCNRGLGFFRDDVERLRAAIAYLDCSVSCGPP